MLEVSNNFLSADLGNDEWLEVHFSQVEVQDKKLIIDSLKRALHESQDFNPFSNPWGPWNGS